MCFSSLKFIRSHMYEYFSSAYILPHMSSFHIYPLVTKITSSLHLDLPLLEYETGLV